MSDERDRIDGQIAGEVRAIFYDGLVVQWARDACASLPWEAKAWDRRGGQ